ncbi:MAG TPA: 4Fe-4S dicluster domain-containing protein [Dehalococcoidales bacterium]|nr:4Fe-4S dicluster domain-containing protein [Dehalococcoidales bacterium]
MSQQYSFYFNSQRCLKCYACEIACLQWHGITPGTIKPRRVLEFTRGTFPSVTRQFLSTACRHCAKAPCAETCPVQAIQRREYDGIVVVDRQKCIGCRHCLETCPFGIPQYAEDGTMQKCDMCLDRLEKGQRPFCVSSCPTLALNWGTVAEMTGLAAQKSFRREDS